MLSFEHTEAIVNLTASPVCTIDRTTVWKEMGSTSINKSIPIQTDYISSVWLLMTYWIIALFEVNLCAIFNSARIPDFYRLFGTDMGLV